MAPHEQTKKKILASLHPWIIPPLHHAQMFEAPDQECKECKKRKTWTEIHIFIQFHPSFVVKTQIGQVKDKEDSKYKEGNKDDDKDGDNKKKEEGKRECKEKDVTEFGRQHNLAEGGPKGTKTFFIIGIRTNPSPQLTPQSK